jgi:LPXTG-motif cell wall-anchored protein
MVKRYRAEHPKANRTFTNDSIAKLNAQGVETGNLMAGNTPTTSAAAPENANTLVATNQPPMLPQSDQSNETAAPATTNPTAAQQKHTASTQPAYQSQAQADQSQSSQQPQAASQQLPKTGSPLPLLILIGSLAFAGGTLYFLHR